MAAKVYVILAAVTWDSDCENTRMQHPVLKRYGGERFLKTQHYSMHALSFPVGFQDQIFIDVVVLWTFEWVRLLRRDCS